ncbi:MAG TPA: bifunctional nicotinamidase/pyrazinamidase [Chthoniobacterales bacterium]
MSNGVLLLIDVQRDFLPGGALGVPGGDEIVPLINQSAPRYAFVLATRDFHPADHCSFATNHAGRKPGDVVEVNGIDQVLWPPHCVQGTAGAEFAPGMDAGLITKTFLKGIDPGLDSYSAFFDNARKRSTGLAEYLDAQGCDRLDLCGLATDYCVLWSVLDARSLGIGVTVLADACRGIDLKPGDTERAFARMQKAGATLARFVKG